MNATGAGSWDLTLRREKLMSWGFNCACARCIAEEAAAANPFGRLRGRLPLPALPSCPRVNVHIAAGLEGLPAHWALERGR